MLPLVAIGMGRSWSEMTAFLMLDVFKKKTLRGGAFIVIITLGVFYRRGGYIKVIFLKKMQRVYVNRQASPSPLCGDTDLYKTHIFSFRAVIPQLL